jgi:hypothetical protein
MRLDKLTADTQKEFLSAVYDILIQHAKAPSCILKKEGFEDFDNNKQSFVSAHLTENEYPCTEWRFQGALGFGGKYYIYHNKVTCYSEDLNATRKQIIIDTNTELSKLEETYLTK